jgi:hypothetical protein
MGLWLDVYTKVTRLALFVGQILPFTIFWNWVRLYMKVVIIGCQEVTHIKKTKIPTNLVAKKNLEMGHNQ